VRAVVASTFPAWTQGFESWTDFFYCDVKGLVSIGPGFLADPTWPALLDFVRKGSTVPASPDEIRRDWQIVKSNGATCALGGGHYEPMTTVRATRASIERVAGAKLGANAAMLKQTFPAFEEWPARAQLAILGMAWAYGAAFTRTWPRFTAACRAQDWATAAEQSVPSAAEMAKQNDSFHRRVAATEALFLAAAADPQDLEALP
jgi:hypothetical protein